MKYLYEHLNTLYRLTTVLRRWFMLIVLAGCFSISQAAAFNMDQTISDGAQRTTLAFSGLAMMTGNLEAQSFFPPGKVADYTGFQYLRDNDADSMGHNTSFLTKVAGNVMITLTDAQLTELSTLATAQATQAELYGYKRFALMKAFRRLLEGDVPTGSTGLNLTEVKKASRELYLIDGQISFDRAMLYVKILNSLDATQKAYLDAMKGKGWNSWPDVTDAQLKARMDKLPQGTSVAVMTYASDLFSWYSGSLDADVYFCPERHGTYFGSFYIKDAPAIGHEGYSINEQLTATAGAALCDSSKGYVTDSQAALMSTLVDLQRNNLYAGTSNIVDTRKQIATLLRSLLVSTSTSAAINAQVLALSGTYGDLDGENNYNYATVFAQVYKSLTDAQKTKLMDLRKSIMSGTYADGTAFDFTICNTPFLYSSVITDKTLLSPYIDDTDYLFLIGSDTTVATPTFSPLPGTYSSATQVTLSCTTTGATIRYTINGTIPTTSSTIYTAPITVSATTTINAIGYKDSMTQSATATGAFVISSSTQTVATPTFSPLPGTYSSATQVTLSCSTSGATIRYTTNGTTPTSTSTIYTAPITVSATTTINAIAYKSSMTQSATATGAFVISSSTQKVATPVFTVLPGTYTAATTVGITCATSAAVIRYTTNGTTPTSTSAIYTKAITVSTTTTLNVKAFRTGFTDSDTLTGTYVISISTQKVATPVFTVAAGTYSGPTQIGITCATAGAVIRVTIDGSTPTSTSAIYSSQLIITKSLTITAKAFKSGMTESDSASAAYEITAITPVQGADLMLKTSTVSQTIGEGIFSTDGSQVAEKTAASGKIASYIIILKNSGNNTDSFTVTGIGSKSGWYVNLANISGTTVTKYVMSSSGLIIPLVPAGRVVYLRLDVSPLSGTAMGDTIDVMITATSKTNSSKVDTVKATTTKVSYYRY